MIDPNAEPGSQSSVEWLMERVGKVTASRFGAVLDYTAKGLPGAGRKTYLWEVAIERLTGQPTVHYVNAAMERGSELEPLARMAYEARTGAMVEQTGLRNHLSLPMTAGSPDGLVGLHGGLEIKCLNSAKHLEIWLGGMPDEYRPQVQGLMWLHGRDWWDFCAFDDRMPEDLQLCIQRIPYDPEYCSKLEAEIVRFQVEVAELLAKIEQAKARA